MSTLAPSSLIGSSSFLQVKRKCIKACMSSNFGKIPLPVIELAVLGGSEQLAQRATIT